jgi:hypothetical protein
MMYMPGGTGLVFDVTAVETVKQDVQGTRATSPETERITRSREDAGQRQSPWTVFHLRAAGAIETMTPAIHRGR